MCGIDGYFSFDGHMCAVEKFYESHKLIGNRGPDDEGFIIRNNDCLIFARGERTSSSIKNGIDLLNINSSDLIMGHCRLSIMDLSINGHQPMTDDSFKDFLSYNGEVYNYKEIRGELEHDYNISFVSDSDTEVVYRAIQIWGVKAFNKFNGMWAVAYYDDVSKTLLLSRDRIGVKPLFFYKDERCIVFASELKFIINLLDKLPPINDEVALNYLNKCKINCDNNTFWKNIHEVLPGTCITVSKDNFKQIKYWNLVVNDGITNIHEALEKFSYIFNSAIKLRLQSDVPLGVALSGGLDSNLILGECLKCINKVDTFSIVFSQDKYSEKKYIDNWEKDDRVKLHYIYPDVNDLTCVLDKYLKILDQPSRSFSEYSLFLLYKYIRENTYIRVILNGQGSDECFAGYTSHYYLKFAQLLLEKNFINCYKEMQCYKQMRNESWSRIGICTLYNLLKYVKYYKNFNETLSDEVIVSPLREYLTYDDRLSMAFGIESRAPFVDYRLVEFAYELHHSLKISNGVNKFIPRLYASNIIPNNITNRKDKMGFISPQEEWQKKELLPFIAEQVEGFHRKVMVGDLNKAYKKYIITDIANEPWNKVWRIACFNRWLDLNR